MKIESGPPLLFATPSVGIFPGYCGRQNAKDFSMPYLHCAWENMQKAENKKRKRNFIILIYLKLKEAVD